jgi:integrase
MRCKHEGYKSACSRKWELQHRPTVTESELSAILSDAKGRYAVLFSLLAGTGLRIGEALALRVTDFSQDCSVLYVRRSVWHGQEQEPKAPSAVRVVDIAEPLAQLLRGYVNGKVGYLFATKNGSPLQQRNVLRALHATGKKVGFHAFRRFPNGDIAPGTCAGRPDEALARPRKTNRNRLLRRRVGKRRSVEAGMV